MVQGLNVARLVNVDVTTSPQAAAVRNFGLTLVIGDSDVISGEERFRSYTDIDAVADDFGTSAPEYLAAQLYFSQVPRPEEIIIGRWLRTATAGFLDGGILSSEEQLISLWTAIDDGTFTISFDDNEEDVTGLDFTAQTTLNGVATVINGALSGGTVAWDGERFIATSDTTGVDSTVSYATAEGTGTDISEMLKLTEDLADTPVDGFAAETAVAGLSALYDASGDWYFSLFAASTMPSDDDLVACAAFIEAAAISRVLAVTDTDERELDSTYDDDISTRLRDLLYERSFVQFSENQYAASSLTGRFASVDFNANNTTITAMYKQEPGVVAQYLTETQANTLQTKRCNVFVNYANSTAIIQYGVMSYNLYIDERQGLDWLQNAIQEACFNLLYTSATKIPQTNDGNTKIVNAITAVLNQAVNNGLVAPGQWNADGFGVLKTGSYLPLGYYIFAPNITTQLQADREARKSVPIQVAVKLAGAIHTVDVLVNVNR
jgi:hypothetical protein